jgi:hypothetical protein
MSQTDTEIIGKSLMINGIWDCLLNSGLLDDSMVLFRIETAPNYAGQRFSDFPQHFLRL